MSVHNETQVLVNLREQIASVQSKLSLLSTADLDYTGNKFDDTLMAVSADSKRDYWEARLLELESLLAQYTAPKAKRGSAANKGVVEGDVIKLQRSDGRTLQFRLVSRADIFPGERCVTLNSPIGKAVVGKQPGESFAIQTPSGSVSYQLIEIDRG